MPIPTFEQKRVQPLLDGYGDCACPLIFVPRFQIIARQQENSFILPERRPAWRRRGEWTELRIAKFRYFVGRKKWVLYRRDRNERWFRYDLIEASRDIELLLAEPDRDPTKDATNESRGSHGLWIEVAPMRDRLIHNYFGVDYEIVWDVVVNRIPEFRQQISAILEA